MFCKVIVLLFMRFEQNNVSRVVKKMQSTRFLTAASDWSILHFNKAINPLQIRCEDNCCQLFVNT